MPGKTISLYIVEGQKPIVIERGWEGSEYVERSVGAEHEQQYFTAIFGDMAIAFANQRPEDDKFARQAAIDMRVHA